MAYLAPSDASRDQSEAAPRFALSETEFCKAIGISRMTAFRLREAGKLSYCKIGNRILYLPRHVTEFLEAHERRAER